jgi:serine/threonine protein kinase
LNTTRFSRGTQGYRAPEVLREDARYNNKADIFALGCILFEITIGKKLFRTDWGVREYFQQTNLDTDSMWPACRTGTRLDSLGYLARTMLSKDAVLRPSAREVLHQLTGIRCGTPLSQVHATAFPPYNPSSQTDPEFKPASFPSVDPRHRRSNRKPETSLFQSLQTEATIPVTDIYCHFLNCWPKSLIAPPPEIKLPD